jgi:tetratricopeptide (TPR) repeat protein
MFGFFPTSRSPNTFYRDHARISGVFLMLRKWMTFLVVALVGFSVLTGSGFCSLSWAAEETSNDASKEAANNTSSNTANDASKEAANNTAKDAASEATSETPKETAKDTANNEAQKYHAALQKRPEPGYLFDRFYNAWLDQGTAESLQEFLQKQVEQSDTTANRLLLAFFDSKQNNDVAAIEEFGKALKNEPANAAAWFYKAQAESRVLDFETAVADLKHARELNPNAKLSVLIERQLGTMLLRNHKTDEALEVWQALLKANPADEELCEDVVELHIEEGLFKEAATLQESLIAKTKDPYTAVMRRLRLGDIHHRAGQRQKAIDVYAATLAESGQDTWLEREILAQIEQIFRVEDDLAGLKKEYATLLETYPKRIGLQRRRCRLLADLGEPDEAVKGYRAILELTPGNREYREEYVDMLCRVGKQDLAVKELKVLCEQNPKDAELQVRLAKTLQEAKQSDEAVEAVKQYLQIAEQNEYAYLRAARLVESFGDKERAAEFYRTMVEKFSDSPSAQEAYAAFLYANNKKEDAQAIWKTQMQTADVAHALGIARALESRGEDAAVMELLKSREKDFGADPLFLGQLVNTSLRLKQFEQAIPWAKRRVELSQNATDLENAVSQIVTACQQCDKVHVLIDELKQSSDRPIALTCLLAELLESAGESKEADELLRGPTEKGDLLAVGEQIRLFTLRGEWANAADATRRLFELSGGRQSQYVRKLVELYERDSRLDEALKWVETWKRLSTGATTPWLTEVRLLKLQGKENDSLATLQKAIQRFEEDEELKVQLAQAFQDTGKPRDAERVYWQLYEKTNDAGNKLRWAAELAKLAQREGTVSRLVESFRQRSHNNRDSMVPLLALAEVYRVTNDYENRRQSLLTATKLKPDDLQLLTQIARLEEVEGDWKSALATLEQAAKLDKTTQTQQKIAQVQMEYGNRDAGLAMLRELLGEQIADPRTLEHMADSLCSMQEWDRAAELLRVHIADHPGDYRLHYLLGVCYEESGHTTEAMAQFVSLLDNQEELPSTKKSTKQNQSMFGPYLDILRRLLPDETVEWFQLQQFQHVTYSYRQRNGVGGYRVSMASPAGSVASIIPLPPSVDVVRSYAMVHLLALANGFDDPQQAALIADMKTHGIRSPKTLMKLGLNLNNGMPALGDALEEDPDNESLLAFFVFFNFQQPRTDKTEDLVRAFKKFRESRPELAVMAAIQAASLSTEQASILNDAFAIASKIDHPNPLLVMGLARSLGGQPGMPSNGTSALNDEQRAKVVQLLVHWYPKISQENTIYGPWAFICVVNAVRAGGNPETYIALLDDEVVQWRKNAGNQSNKNTRTMFFGQPNTSLLEVMPFPPQELTNFPPNLCGLLNASPNNPYAQMANEAGSANWEPEKIEPLIQKVKDPTLRVLLAHRHELPKIVESTLKEMIEKKPPQLDAYLMAAGKAGADSHYSESVNLLETARQLPMKEEMRRRVDAAIVASVLAAKTDNKSDENLLKSGRDAALRLRRQRLDQQQRGQLVGAFSDLGLGEEAKKLEKQMNAGSTSPATAPAMYASPASPTPKDRIDKLIAAGNRDAAVRQLASDVKTLGQSQLANVGNIQYFRYQMRELKKRIADYGMTDDVKKQFEPGDTNNPTRLNECAMAMEMFDQGEGAQKIYERILAQRPKDDVARVRLLEIMLTTKADDAAFEASLSQLSDNGCSLLGQILASSANDSDTDWEDRFRNVELAIRFLGKQKDHPRTNFQWADQLLQAFGRQQYSNKAQRNLPSLYQTTDSFNGQPKVDAEILERRAKLHHDLCLQMMETPDLGRSGFRHLLAAAEVKGDVVLNTAEKQDAVTPETEKSTDPQAIATKSNDTKGTGKANDEFRQHAEKILSIEIDPKKQRNQPPQVFFYGNNGDEIRFRGPEEYLVLQAWRSGDWSRIDQEWMPKTKEGVGRQKLKTLERLVKLYRCPTEEFLATAKEAVKESAAAMQPGMPMTNDGLNMVVDVWGDRMLTVEIQPLILDAMRRNASGMGNPSMGTVPSRYFEILIAKGQQKQAQDLLEELAVIYLGPTEKRAEFIKKNYNRNSMTVGSPNAKIQAYFSILEQLARRNSLFFLVLGQAESLSDVTQNNNLSSHLQTSMNRMRSNPVQAVAILEASPWMADLEPFRVMPLGQQVDKWPLVQALRENSFLSDSQMKPFWTALEEKQKTNPTFGRGLFLAAQAQQKEKKALLEFVEKHVEAIQKLPAEQQANLSLLIKAILSSEAKHELSNEGPAKIVGQWLDQGEANHSAQVIEKFAKAKRYEDLGFSGNGPWEVGQHLGEILPDVIRENPQAATKIFWQVPTLIEDAQKRGVVPQFGSSQPLPSMILEQMLQQRNNRNFDPAMIAFLIDLFGSPEGNQLSMNDWMLNNAMQQWYHQARQGKNASSAFLDTFKQIYEDFGQVLNDRSTTLLIPCFGTIINQQGGNDKDLQSLDDWVKQEMQNGKYPALAADLHACIAMHQARRKNNNSNTGETQPRLEPADYHEHFRKRINEAEAALPPRLIAAAYVVEQQGAKKLPLDLARDIVQLYIAAMEKDATVTSSQHKSFLDVLGSIAQNTSGQEDATNKEFVDKWREQFAKRYLHVAPQNRKNRASSDINNPDALCVALQLYLAANDMEHVNLLLTKYDSTLAQTPLVLASLVRSGQTDLAVRCFRSHWASFRYQWSNSNVAQYDEAIAKNAVEFLGKLNDESERYVAEVLLATMPDVVSTAPGSVQKAQNGKSPSEKAAAPRDQRLTALAGRLKEVKFTNKALKTKAISGLVLSDKVAPLLAEEIAEEYKNARIVQILENNQFNEMESLRPLLICHVKNCLMANNVQPIMELYGKLSTVKNNANYIFNQLGSPLLTVCYEVLAKENMRWTVDQSKQVAPALRAILKDPNNCYQLGNQRGFVSLLLLTHIQAGQSEELIKLFEGLPGNVKSHLSETEANIPIVQLLQREIGKPTPENLQQRIACVQDLLRVTLKNGWFVWNLALRDRIRGDKTPLFQRVVDSELMTPEELIEHGPALVEKLDDAGIAKAALAVWMQEKKVSDKAITLWQSAIAAVPDKKQQQANYWRWDYARLLWSLDKKDEAKAVTAEIDEKIIEQNQRAGFQRFRSGVIPKEAPAPDSPKPEK